MPRVLTVLAALVYIATSPKMMLLAVRNLRRNLLRTLLTSLAIMVLVMMVTLIWTVVYFLDKTTLQWSLDHYCRPGVDLKDPRISPLRAADLSGLPPAHIHTAEFDPFRDEGKAYADRLERAGVKVRYACHDGMIHHFYGMAAIIPYARTAMTSAGAAIKLALA